MLTEIDTVMMYARDLDQTQSRLQHRRQQLAKESVAKAAGDAGEAAYWWLKMLVDPTQRAARKSHGYAEDSPWFERDAFKHVFSLFRSLS